MLVFAFSGAARCLFAFVVAVSEHATSFEHESHTRVARDMRHKGREKWGTEGERESEGKVDESVAEAVTVVVLVVVQEKLKTNSLPNAHTPALAHATNTRHDSCVVSVRQDKTRVCVCVFSCG